MAAPIRTPFHVSTVLLATSISGLSMDDESCHGTGRQIADPGVWGHGISIALSPVVARPTPRLRPTGDAMTTLKITWSLVLTGALVTAACGDSKSSMLPTSPSAVGAVTQNEEAGSDGVS